MQGRRTEEGGLVLVIWDHFSVLNTLWEDKLELLEISGALHKTNILFGYYLTPLELSQTLI